MANLATMIMEGTTFSKNDSSIDISGYDFSKQVLFESDSLNSAVVSLYTDVLEAEQRYMVSDVIAGASAIRALAINESFEAQSVMEGMFTSFVKKIVDSLKKFWAKIVEWFKKAIEWFRMMFSNAKEFAKRYGKELRNKKYDGFKHEGFEWTLKAGNDLCDEWISKFETKLQNLCGKITSEVINKAVNDTFVDDERANNDSKYDNSSTAYDDEEDFLSNNSVVEDHKEAKRKDNEKKWEEYNKRQRENLERHTGGYLSESTSVLFEADYSNITYKAIASKSLSDKWEDGDSVSDTIDKAIKEITKADDLSDMRSTLEEKYRNGDSEKSTINEFGSGEYNTPSKIIDFLEKSDKTISDIEKNRKSIEKPISQLIKQIERMKVDSNNAEHKAAESKIISNISYASSLASSMLNCIKTCIDVKVTAHRDATRELLSAMKRFYSYKSEK